MKNWKLFPSNKEITKYVECYWFLEKEPGDTSHQYPKLNPDPATHLIITQAHTPYHYAADNKLQTGNGSHWLFQHLNTFTMDHSQPFQIIGIKFKIGGPYSLLNQDCKLVTNLIQAVDIKKLTTSTVNLAQLLSCAANQPKQAAIMLDNLLSDWCKTNHNDQHIELTRQVLTMLETTVIADIGAKLYRSQRTLERSFTRVTGLTMKQTQSMIRLEEMLEHLYSSTDKTINWADIATKYGFSDQPHLIRYLKASIGQTPGQYAKQRNLTIDIYGNFEFD
ncbi:hypothetical protein tinsulaeT_18090 [Thalassotalea insulae]|uniref:HTH araC/xylS-type domain-containing protein n=1 Tax=Thalassotalea insulae TaxID=2056778 RepID=A0ABQ6GT31_9GAMM|nr:helix-turn-helix domain-containing protein [Thalassotalea insulae]GLX78469.1 hypothetical protein tinsulaeT_18090 [Thalassotalea insulae]